MSYNAISKIMKDYVMKIEIQPTWKSKDLNQLNMYSCYIRLPLKNIYIVKLYIKRAGILCKYTMYTK